MKATGVRKDIMYILCNMNSWLRLHHFRWLGKIKNNLYSCKQENAYTRLFEANCLFTKNIFNQPSKDMREDKMTYGNGYWNNTYVNFALSVKSLFRTNGSKNDMRAYLVRKNTFIFLFSTLNLCANLYSKS